MPPQFIVFNHSSFEVQACLSWIVSEILQSKITRENFQKIDYCMINYINVVKENTGKKGIKRIYQFFSFHLVCTEALIKL